MGLGTETAGSLCTPGCFGLLPKVCTHNTIKCEYGSPALQIFSSYTQWVLVPQCENSVSRTPVI